MIKNLFLASDEPHWALVCLIGVSVVFVGLACIIGLVELMNLATNKIGSKKKAKGEPQASVPAQTAAQTPAQASASGVIENRDEIVAAVCAAIAEANGTDISAIRVVSFKKV